MEVQVRTCTSREMQVVYVVNINMMLSMSGVVSCRGKKQELHTVGVKEDGTVLQLWKRGVTYSKATVCVYNYWLCSWAKLEVVKTKIGLVDCCNVFNSV